MERFESLKVKKWGGENAAEFKKSPENVVKDFKENIKQVIVVSAVRAPEFNTTDNLIQLADFLKKGELKNIYEKLFELEEFHKKVLNDKLGGNLDIQLFISKYFEILRNGIKVWFNYYGDDKIFPSKDNDYSIGYGDYRFSIIGFGEELSAKLQVELINNLKIKGLEAQNMDLSGVTTGLEDEKESIIFKYLSREIATRVDKILNLGKIPVVSGYIPGFKDGIENKIGRGYSDATAAITSVGLGEKYDVTLEIQKSVQGMLSADPRIVSNPKLIENIDYLTAKEITGIRGSQAKLLHSQVLRKELLKQGIKVRLFDPFKDTRGTLITKTKNLSSSGVEYIGARDNIIFFSISSWDMADSGILAKVFDVVRKYNISVDIVSTSETEISFTIDNQIEESILKKLVKEIQQELDIEQNDDTNFVKYKKDKALVFCVGQNLKHSMGALAKATETLARNNINVELMSQGSMERSIVFGIDAKKMKDAVKILHNEFIK